MIGEHEEKNIRWKFEINKFGNNANLAKTILVLEFLWEFKILVMK